MPCSRSGSTVGPQRLDTLPHACACISAEIVLVAVPTHSSCTRIMPRKPPPAPPRLTCRNHLLLTSANSFCAWPCVLLSTRVDEPFQLHPNKRAHPPTCTHTHAQEGTQPQQQVQDPYANEPKRHPAMVVRTDRPYNAEPPPEVLAATPITPNEFFYVRNHLPVPHIDAATYKVRISGRKSVSGSCSCMSWLLLC